MRTWNRFHLIAGLCTAAVLSATPSPAHADDAANDILSTSGVKGGLIVHVGCGDGRLTAGLHAGDAYLVQGLDADASAIAAARAHITSLGLGGKVSAIQWDGERLPYVDNTVNLLVVDADVSQSEIDRVLAPLGVAMTKEDGAWSKTVKPWPESIDEWTHYMHDPSNNAVAHDTAIGPLRHLQWDGAPRYARHHEYTSSVAAMVTAKGRLFSIMDWGSRASIQMPAKWRLTARDAFNGVVLWEKPIDEWFNHLWPLKDGPAQPPRHLVAVGDSVYVTLGLDAPVSRLDAATGEVLHVYEGTEFTQEILVDDGRLILLQADESMNPEDYYPKLMVCWDEKKRTEQGEDAYLLGPTKRHILSIDAESGEVLWRADHSVEPLSLTADADKIYFHDWTCVACLDRESGELLWKSEPAAARDTMGLVYGPTLVAYGDVVLFADGRRQRKIHAFSKADGAKIWDAPHYAAGHAGSAEDLFVIDGLVWCGKIAGGKDSGVFTGRDPNTGEVVREFMPDVETYWFHHRCHRSKATDNYILASRTGIEFVDVREQTWETHHWVRGACTYGVLPANGLVYAPPHPCACYLESKMSGLCALAAATQRLNEATIPARERLVKGPAYGDSPGSSDVGANDWPTYRHDMGRSGSTKASLTFPLTKQWGTKLEGRLTAPVVADGRVFVAAKDKHALHAIDAKSGDVLWTFTADGPIDSPPTCFDGRVLFGSRDGHVYCLRASDGALVYRFTAAPSNSQMVSYGSLESVWPVHGNVLVRDGVAYVVAGRSTMVDGGLRFYQLAASTGRVIAERVLCDQHNPQIDVNILNMPTALADILSTDGERLFMMSQVLDFDGNRIETIDPALDPPTRATTQIGETAHLFSPTGFLDDNAWHRSYWVHGRAFSAGCNWWYRNGRYAPAGRILVCDDDHVYGFGRQPALFVWTHVLENHLFCSERQADPESIARVFDWAKKGGRDATFNRSFTRAADPKQRLAPELNWSRPHPPLHARALLKADDALIAAGLPDVLDEDEAFDRPFQADVEAKKAAQDAAYDGFSGGLLMAVSPNDGALITQLALDAPPVWDGMAATDDGLFLVTADGQVLRLGGK